MKVKYIRISTVEQNTSRQEEATNSYDKVLIDKITGTSKLFERPQGKVLKSLIESKAIKELHVHSIDRLGRNTLDILSTIKFLTSNNACLISEKENIKTLDSDGKENITTKLIINVLSTIAEFENDRRKERQKEGIAVAKIKGVYKGRLAGSTDSEDKLLAKYPNVVKELSKGTSIRRTALLCKNSKSTVLKVSKILRQAN